MGLLAKFKRIFKGPEAKPIYLQPKKLGDAVTIGDALTSICDSLQAHYERDIAGQGIRLCIILDRTGEKYCGQGVDTKEAYNALYHRLKKLELV